MNEYSRWSSVLKWRSKEWENEKMNWNKLIK